MMKQELKNKTNPKRRIKMTNSTMTKKESIKEAAFSMITEKNEILKSELSAALKSFGSDRTISRALAEIEKEGLITKITEDNKVKWVINSIKPCPEETIKEEKPVEESTEATDSIETLKENFPGVSAHKELQKEISEEKPVEEKTETKKEKKEKPLSETDIFLKNIYDSWKKENIVKVIKKILQKRKLKDTIENRMNIDKELQTSTILFEIQKKKELKKKMNQAPPVLNETEPKKEKTEKTEKTAKKAKTAKNEKPAAETKKSGTKKEKEVAGTKKTSSMKRTTEPKAVKKAGVIDCIIASLKKGPISKKGLLKNLTKKFPERDPEKMIKTINVQVPTRLRNEKGFKIEKTEKGYTIIEK